MIAFLKGLLHSKQETTCVVEVGGVGYEVSMPASELDRLPAAGEPVTLHTWYLGREDGVQLYGFLNLESRQLFKLLLGISGIGPKSALAILSGLSYSQLAQAVMQRDTDAFSRLPGIGRKTAERLLLELKDKLKVPLLGDAQATGGQGRGEYAEALEALVSLGYPATQARLALQKVADQVPAKGPAGKDRVPELVRLALRQL